MNPDSSTFRYRGFTVTFDPKPGPRSIAPDWDYVHDDYDGAPDAFDPRCGSARTPDEARADIDEIIEEYSNA